MARGPWLAVTSSVRNVCKAKSCLAIPPPCTPPDHRPAHTSPPHHLRLQPPSVAEPLVHAPLCHRAQYSQLFTRARQSRDLAQARRCGQLRILHHRSVQPLGAGRPQIRFGGDLGSFSTQLTEEIGCNGEGAGRLDSVAPGGPHGASCGWCALHSPIGPSVPRPARAPLFRHAFVGRPCSNTLIYLASSGGCPPQE